MHIFGKILAWTVLLAAIAGTVLMSRELQVRNSYTKKLKDLKQKNATDAKSIEQKEADLRKLDAEFQRVMHDQLDYWDKRSGIPDPASGTIGMGVGLQNGVGIKATNPKAGNQAVQRRTRLSVFYQPNPRNSQTVYVGPFNLSDKPNEVTKSGSRLYPAWKLRPGEIGMDNPRNWPRGRNVYRIRAAVPTGYVDDGKGGIQPVSPEIFRDLYLKLDDTARDIAAANATKKQADDLQKAAEAEVTKYRVIIAGNDGTGGMLAELSKAEDNRDTVLGVVDRLRRELKREVDTRAQLIQQNKDLVKKLPQPASPSGKR